MRDTGSGKAVLFPARVDVRIEQDFSCNKELSGYVRYA